VDKYRPRTLAEVAGQSEAVAVLRDFAAMPYSWAFILAGDTGTGKTSAAWALAADLGCDIDFAPPEFGGLFSIPSGEHNADAIGLIAERSLGTPRLAVGLLDGCMDTAIAQGGKSITRDIVRLTCQIWGIDSLGLDRVARTYLGFLRDMGGGPIRLNVLAAKLDGLAKTTVERKVEPDMVWLGLIEKQANGRTLTASGREHLRKDM